ncbi:ATP-binding protein [Flavobacterium sp. CBA20B-1]|uniref:sensor histidine kinase n=1 Tax=unclassified Flavobacterium TaxID=196869 RepID=UPI002224B443|nr:MULTISPECIES: sensor histidine kinase [unclassified Flavobacterium]WCM41900.1 ATP-binding protein [Flavobacterium sp. CBA20B-1]
MSEELKIKDGLYKIRPAGRHIITIGRDLIKDKYAAIVELVKNSYDADSPLCKVSLLPFEKKIIEEDKEKIIKGIRVIIKDEGHGMSFETVTDKWMVPSTDDKLHRKLSPKKRIMQGKKGIGRYSASMIGDDLVLQTVDESGDLTTLYLIWKHFEDAKYLNDVDVLIENFRTDRPSGTEIIIVGDENHLNEWDAKQLRNLKSELKKLIHPVDEELEKEDKDKFKITLELGDFPFEGYSNVKEDIEPYPLFELFDYRISGTVSEDGVASLKFENNRIKGAPVEELKDFKILLNHDSNEDKQSYCGELKIDFRVFDRDPASIDGLIERGLKDPVTGEYVGRREARIILDTFNGVGVYRNGFRIRPLGDAGFDWLYLDNERVQNPSLRVGCDQVIGFIHIQSEDSSGLVEKSARDGLKENAEYFGLREVAKQVLKELENRRFAYRQNVGLGRSNRDINEKIKALYNFKDLQEKIDKELDVLGIEKSKREKINKLISEKEEKSNKIADELKQVIALYQGQATVGKIVNVVLHEGRKPLGYFKNQIPLIYDWSKELEENFSQELLDKIIHRLSVIEEQGEIFVKLFGKLDPLSAKKRDRKKDFNLRDVINNVIDVFQLELANQQIEVKIDCDINQTVYGWKEDFYIVLTNLVDNSIFWLQSNTDKPKQISLKVYEEDELIIIEYRDSGPGIEKHLIENEVIFEPEFSNKTGGGTGLGLAIAGEAIDRNDGDLKAIYSEDGAFFKIEVKIQ